MKERKYDARVFDGFDRELAVVGLRVACAHYQQLAVVARFAGKGGEAETDNAKRLDAMANAMQAEDTVVEVRTPIVED